MVVTFLPKSAGFGAFINCQAAVLAPFHSFIGRGCRGAQHSWGLSHVHPGFQPSSNPTEGCTDVNNIYIAQMGM